jgi:hypothetical protein
MPSDSYNGGAVRLLGETCGNPALPSQVLGGSSSEYRK